MALRTATSLLTAVVLALALMLALVLDLILNLILALVLALVTTAATTATRTGCSAVALILLSWLATVLVRALVLPIRLLVGNSRLLLRGLGMRMLQLLRA